MRFSTCNLYIANSYEWVLSILAWDRKEQGSNRIRSFKACSGSDEAPGEHPVLCVGTVLHLLADSNVSDSFWNVNMGQQAERAPLSLRM